MNKFKTKLNIFISRTIFFNKRKIEIIITAFIIFMVIGMAAVSVPYLLGAMLRLDSIDINEFIPERNTALSRITQMESLNDISQSGLSTLQMTENFFFGQYSSLDNIYNRTGQRDITSQQMANYLENMGLYVNTISFYYLRDLLIYLERNQIPAIMHIDWNHYVLFTGYNMRMGLIHIIDPYDPGKLYINFGDLLNSLSETNTLNGNIIMVSNRIENEVTGYCDNNNHENLIDSSILYAISEIYCNNCGSLVRIHQITS